MTVRDIAKVGHPILRQRAQDLDPQSIASEKVQSLIADLLDTMRAANGAGIAAPQIFEPWRATVIEVGENPRYPYKPKIPLTILINPVIEILSNETFWNYEGCLSVPNLRGKVKRFAEIRVTALDEHGRPFERICKGITAGTFQHECDHLDGKLFIDRVEDPNTFSTWENFQEFHRDAFVQEVHAIVAKYGQ